MTLLAFPAMEADPVEAFTVDFTTKTTEWPSIQSYSQSNDSKVNYGGSKWTIYAMSNNQGAWDYMRCGAKSTSKGDFYILNKSAIAEKLTKAELIVSNKIRETINSATLKVADNYQFTNATDYPVSSASDLSNAGTWTFNISNPIANGYYKLVINYTNSTTKNGVIDVTYLKFYKGGVSQEEASVEWITTGWTDPTTDGTAGSPIELKVGETFNLKANILPAEAASLIDLKAVGNGISVSKNADGDWTINASEVSDNAYVEAYLTSTDKYFLASDDNSKETYRCYFKVVEGEVETIVPEQAVSDPVADNGTIIKTKGETITFSAPNATKLSVKVGDADAALVANPYTYTVTEDVTVKVTPVDNKGQLYDGTVEGCNDLSLTVNIDAVAKVPGQVVANPAGTDNKLDAVAGSKVTFSSTDAAKLSVKIGEAAATEQANPYEYTVTEGETTVTVTPIDSDNALHADKALTLTITGTVPQNWVFTNVSGVSDINDGDFVVIVGKVKDGSDYYAMTNALNSKDDRIGAKNVTVTDNSITLEKGQAEIAVVKVVKNAEHKVSFKGNNGYVYGGDNTETSWSVGATYGAISDLDNNYSTKGFKYITNGNRWLQLYTTSDFRGYASQSGGYVFLFKCPNYVDKAPEAGEVTFTPDGSEAVSRGTEVKMTSANAKQIAYKVTIGETEGETVTVAANASNSATYTITEACTIEAWGINADGVEGTHNTATYTLNVAAPKYVTFSVKEGHYTEEALEVALGVDPDANPACEIFYTLDATKASAEKADGEKLIKYKEPITIKPVEGFQTVTLNVFARNTEGSTVGAATYALGCTKTTDPSLSADKWYRVNSLADLVDGDEVIIVAKNHKKAVSTKQKNNNRDAVDVVIDEDGAISTIADNVAKFTISSKPGDWTLATSAWTDKDGNAKASGYMYTSGSTTPIWRTSEDLNSVTNATYSFQLDFDVTDNDRMTMRYNVSDSNMNEFVAYNGSGSNTLWSTYVTDYGELNMESYESPSFYKKGGAPRFEIVEDLYLYQEKEEYVDDDAEDFAGYQEAAYRFTYDKANNEYTLSLPGLAGQFWIRDGKANHAGTFFGTDVNVANVADKPAAAPRRAAASQLDVNGNKYVEGEDGVWHNLVWRQDQHAKFDTHTYNADATVASHNAIENPTITVKYVPGSHTNALMMITGNNVTTGVEGITNDVDGGEAVYFNMQGLRVNEPQKGGVYVRVQNGKAVKVIRN